MLNPFASSITDNLSVFGLVLFLFSGQVHILRGYVNDYFPGCSGTRGLLMIGPGCQLQWSELYLQYNCTMPSSTRILFCFDIVLGFTENAEGLLLAVLWDHVGCRG